MSSDRRAAATTEHPRLAMILKLRLQIFARQHIDPDMEAHLAALGEALDRAPATRHATDLIIARAHAHWHEVETPRLILKAITEVMSEALPMTGPETPACRVHMERTVTALAETELLRRQQLLRRAAELLQQQRLHVH